MKRMWLLAFLLMTCLFLYGQTGKTFYAPTFVSDIFMQKDGSIRVAETITYHFTQGQFQYTRRMIPTVEANRVLFLGAEIDGTAVGVQKARPNVQLSHNHGMEVRWNFNTVQDTVHAYTLYYEATAPYRYEVRDLPTMENTIRALFAGKKANQNAESRFVEFLWKPLPVQYDFTIDHVLVRLHLPENVKTTDIQYGRQQSLIPQAVGDSLLVYEFRNVAANQLFKIDVKIPYQLMQVPIPAWQKQMVQREEVMKLLVLLVFLFPLLMVISAIANYRRQVAVYNQYVQPGTIISDFPTPLEAAYVYRLRNPSNQNISPMVFLTLISLAQKGIITITAVPKSKWYESSTNLEFQYSNPDAELTNMEKLVVDKVFGYPPTSEVIKFSAIQRKLMQKVRPFVQAVDDELITHGYLDAETMIKRKQRLLLALILMGLSVMFVVGALAGWMPEIMSAGFVVIFLLADYMLLSVIFTNSLTDRGKEEAAYWHAYSKYLKKQMRQHDYRPGEDEASRIFPYTLALNLGPDWVSFCKKHNIPLANAWVQNIRNADNYWVPIVLIASTSNPSSGAGGSSSSGGSGGGGGSAGAG